MLKRFPNVRRLVSLPQPPSGGCVLKLIPSPLPIPPQLPAAFRRLCVETCTVKRLAVSLKTQPPSGGCVLKPALYRISSARVTPSQPPSGGCVLKPAGYLRNSLAQYQPPSGGCVLKPVGGKGRRESGGQPPSGGCVLKHLRVDGEDEDDLPAAFRRLCVETTLRILIWARPSTSRLQAAVC